MNFTVESEENIVGTPTTKVSKWYADMEGTIRIPLYAIIFIIGLVGNSLVIVTLARNRRLRIVTNVFLLNLAVSDLLLGVFCMPFTLIGTLLREFIFGEIMCKLISYIQGVTVAVNAWTLVAISLERFYAVCEPLRSRRWQTSSHACKVIIGIWISAFVTITPIVWVSQLMPISTDQPSGKYKCRENWPNRLWESGFNIFLDAILLLFPLLVMAVAYFRIALVLRKEIPATHIAKTDDSSPSLNFYNTPESSDDNCAMCSPPKCATKWTRGHIPMHDVSTRSSTITSNFQSMRQSSNSDGTPNVTLSMDGPNLQRRVAIQKRVTTLLVVVVLEFFICWTPIYIINTISSFKPDLVYKGIGYVNISFLHLLSYVSSCCNPVTYCFMNRNFRREFFQTFTRLCFWLKSSSSRRYCGSNPILNG